MGESKMKKERVNRPRHTTTKGTFKNYWKLLRNDCRDIVESQLIKILDFLEWFWTL